MSDPESENWRAAVLRDLASGSPIDSAEALLSLSLNDPSFEFACGAVVGVLSTAADPNLKRLAVVCSGHLARVHGRTSSALVALLEELSASGVLVGEIEDALGDISHFAPAADGEGEDATPH